MELKKSMLSIAAGATAMTLALGSLGGVAVSAYAAEPTDGEVPVPCRAVGL